MNIQIDAKLKENTFCIHVVLYLINSAQRGYIWNPKCDSTTSYGAALLMKCDHSNESYWADYCPVVLFIIMYLPGLQGGSNFRVSGWNPEVWPCIQMKCI